VENGGFGPAEQYVLPSAIVAFLRSDQRKSSSRMGHPSLLSLRGVVKFVGVMQEARGRGPMNFCKFEIQGGSEAFDRRGLIF